MYFGLPPEAVELQHGVRDVLATACGPDVVRAGWEQRPDALWRALGDLGLLGLLVPEPDGMGLDELVMVAALVEAGYAGVPGPLVETVAFAPLVGPGAVAVQRGDAVPYAAAADLVIRLDDVTVVRDPKVDPLSTVDGSRSAGLVTGTPEPVEGDVQRAARRATLGTAAFLVGLSRRMLDLTVAYVSDRQQFGVPVGSFQAVKHPLADALVGVEFAWPAVLRAAQSLVDDDPQAGLHVAMAKALASDAAWATARRTLQAHGAMGYTVEYDLHLFAKRAWALAHDWGTAREHRETIAHALLDDERTAP